MKKARYSTVTEKKTLKPNATCASSLDPNSNKMAVKTLFRQLGNLNMDWLSKDIKDIKESVLILLPVIGYCDNVAF